jgi:RimJ/RimL family protein N-acetyltransferase
VDIGYALLKNYEGKGYAREAANAVIEWAFSTLKINSLCAITTHDNLRSISLLAKLGFVVEKHFKMKLHDKEDFLLFTISKTK